MNSKSCLRAVIVLLLAAIQSDAASYDGDKVKPFAQPEPVTISDRAAVKFKPQLKISGGCHPYPAVASNGYTSAGMEPSYFMTGCKGSDLGSQVYSRSTWHADVWAIMYAWYFPKGVSDEYEFSNDWEFVIVWIDNPDLDNPTILGATVRTELKLMKYVPVDTKYIDGSSVKCKYKYSFWKGNTELQLTEDTGGYQDLITWEQLPNVSRSALNSSDANTPLKDGTFESFLEAGW